MSIEIGSKWVKSGEVVEVVWLNATCVCEYELSGNEKMVWYECDSDTQKNKIRHVLTERDFLEQYKPYEPVYEYEYAYRNNGIVSTTDCYYKNENEFITHEQMKNYQRLDFTKRGTQMKVYIASPVRPLLEVFKSIGLKEDGAMRLVRGVARDGCLKVKKMGLVAVSPILAFDGVYDELTERDKIDAACEALLLACDFIYVVDTPYNEQSKGIARELEIAEKTGIKILEV